MLKAEFDLFPRGIVISSESSLSLEAIAESSRERGEFIRCLFKALEQHFDAP